MNAGSLARRKIRIEAPTVVPDGRGGQVRTFVPRVTLHAEFRYERGREAAVPGGRSGTAVFRVKLRRFAETLEISTAEIIRDTASGEVFNIREIDDMTDRQWVFLRVEGGVAV